MPLVYGSVLQYYYCCWLVECDKMDKEISELSIRILNLKLEIDEEDAQAKVYNRQKNI